MDKAVEEYYKRRADRLENRLEGDAESLRVAIAKGIVRLDDDEEENGGGSHGNTKIPFGLCEREGISIGKGWTPTDAWKALEGKGYSPDAVYRNLRKTGKAAKGSPSAAKGTTMSLKDADRIVSSYRDAKERLSTEKMLAEHAKKEAERAEGSARLAEHVNARIYQDEHDAEWQIGRIPETREQLEAERKEINDRLDAATKKWGWTYKPPKAGTKARKEYDRKLEEAGGYDRMMEDRAKDMEAVDPEGRLSYIKRSLQSYDEYDHAHGVAERKRAEVDFYKQKAKRCQDELTKRQAEISRLEESLSAQESDYKKAFPVKFDSYDKCETFDEIEEKMRNDGCLRGDEKANWSKLDLDSAKEIAAHVGTFFDKLPELRGKLGSIEVKDMEQGTYGAALGNNGVTFNERYFSNMDVLRASLETSVKEGFHPKGVKEDSVIFHEYSHQLDSYMTQKLFSRDGPSPDGEVMNFSTRVLADVSRNLGMEQDACKAAVSEYAKKDYLFIDTAQTGFFNGKSLEFYAEAMSEYLSSSHPRPVAVEVWKVTQKYLKQTNHDSRMDDENKRTDSMDDSVEKYRQRRERRIAVNRFRKRRAERMDAAKWEENDHPRAKDGKFTSGGGGASKAEKGAPAKEVTVKPPSLPKLKKGASYDAGTQGVMKKLQAKAKTDPAVAKVLSSLSEKDVVYQKDKDGKVTGCIPGLAYKADNKLQGYSAEAQKAFDRRAADAPKIAADMASISDKVGGTMDGLVHCCKTGTSLSSKIRRKQEKIKKKDGIDATDVEALEQLDDVVRFTFKCDHDDMTEKCQAFEEELKKSGYEITQRDNKYLDDDPDYKAIHLQLKSKNGDLIELQIHSEESLAVKNVNHDIYDKSRELPEGSKERLAMEADMKKRTRGLRNPKDIEKLPSFP